MISNLTRRLRVWLVGDNHSPEQLDRNFTCGTLRYTPATLAVLFGWLLWGDFTFTLMEAEPGLMIMQVKDYHISASTAAFLLTTLATICNFCLNPVISSWSDRHRGPWGRRRPFLLIATPVVGLTLMLVPWAPEITRWLTQFHAVNVVLAHFPAAPLVIVFGLLVFSFRVANMFITTVYYYLIPDVVPEAFIGRFYGLFRVVGLLASFGWKLLVFPLAHQHLHVIFASFALICVVSFTVMCLKVKEGEYEPIIERHGHWYSGIVNYFVECFSQPRYWLIFMIYGASTWAGAGAIFEYLFYSDAVKLTDKQISYIMAGGNLATLVLAAPFGLMVDRLGSQRTFMIGLFFGAITNLVCFFGIHGYWSALILSFGIVVPSFLVKLSMGKWTVDMYPRAQYGQFASAAAAVGALGMACIAWAFGGVVDAFGKYYRLYLLVPPIFNTAALIGSIALYYYWPAKTPQSVSGFEPVMATVVEDREAEKAVNGD